jgi:hypothetical protein
MVTFTLRAQYLREKGPPASIVEEAGWTPQTVWMLKRKIS